MNLNSFTQDELHGFVFQQLELHIPVDFVSLSNEVDFDKNQALFQLYAIARQSIIRFYILDRSYEWVVGHQKEDEQHG